MAFRSIFAGRQLSADPLGGETMSPYFILKDMEQDERELMLWTDFAAIEHAIERMRRGKLAYPPGFLGLLHLGTPWSVNDVRERIEALRERATTSARDPAPLIKALHGLAERLADSER